MSLNTILATTPLVSTGYHLKATGTTIGNSLIWDNGTNVGIGNTNTSYTLDVSGSLRSTNTAYFATTSGVVGIGTTSVNASTILAVAGSNTVTDARGMVSVNSTNASAADLGGSISLGGENGLGTSPYAFAKISGRKEGAGATYSGYLSLATTFSDGTITERMRITSAGNVGIGTSSPVTKLDIVAGGDAIALALRMRSQDDYSFLQFKNFAGTQVISEIYSNRTADNTGSLIFTTNNGGVATERMRITSGGYTKISSDGTYYGSTGNYHEMVQSASGPNTAIFRNKSASPYGIYFDFNAASPNNTSNYYIAAGDSSANRFFVYSNGAIYSNVVTITPITSDVNLKTDIIDYDKGLNEVLAMKPRYFKYKDNLEEQKIGFIAQEMEEALSGSMINGAENPKTKETYKTYQVEWYPLLVKAIQELSKQNEELSNRLIKLENK
jgi:hypothetical protein